MSKNIEHSWVLGENFIFDVGLELLPPRARFLDFPWTQRCLDYSPVSYFLLGSPFPFHPWTSNLHSIFLAPALLTPCYQACQLKFTASLGGVHIWILFYRGNHPAFHPSHWQVLRDINHLFLSSEESQSV